MAPPQAPLTSETALAPPEAIIIDGTTLPPTHRRFCGAEFKSDDYYLRSAEREAQRLIQDCGLKAGETVLDVGCGQGRLAIGLSRVLPDVKYIGVDVDAASISWCQRHLARPNFAFEHMNVHNARYNASGKVQADGSFRFPLPDASVDTIYLYSVFSHMERDEAAAYLADFARVLKRTPRAGLGRGALGLPRALGGGGSGPAAVFLTTFIAGEGTYLPKGYEVNPPGYVPIRGPLHVVHYARAHFEKMARQAGFKVHRVDAGVETNGQSGIYLRLA